MQMCEMRAVLNLPDEQSILSKACEIPWAIQYIGRRSCPQGSGWVCIHSARLQTKRVGIHRSLDSDELLVLRRGT